MARHSVRKYRNQPIEAEKASKLQAAVDDVNRESGLHIQLVLNEPEAFSGFLAHYGAFSGCSNYFVLAGKPGLDEKVGYYGEKLVLEAQMLGLNTCWVALTYKKSKARVTLSEGEKVYLVIALGYGETQGKARSSRAFEKVASFEGECPAWFRSAVEAALTAPTAVNQQKFHFTLDGSTVRAKAGFGTLTALDLGIVKYHFEIGAAGQKFNWG